MNQESAIHFILENVAAVTASQQQAEVRAARTDRQIKGLQAMMLTGMKMMARLQSSQRGLKEQMKELALRKNGPIKTRPRPQFFEERIEWA